MVDALANDPAGGAVPLSVAARVQTMTLDVDDLTREVLGNAAALGYAFPLRTIARLIPAGAGRSLDELVRRGLLHEQTRDSTVSYDFGHPLVHEAVYEAIGAASRRELHARIARTIAEEPLGVRAYHAALGALPGDREAVTLIRDAARAAEQAQAHREALTHLSAALALTSTSDPDRAALLDEIAWQASEAGDHATGVPALQELLRTREDDRERGIVRMRLASLLSAGLGDLDGAEAEASEAVRLFQSCGAQDRLPVALNELGWIRGELGDLPAQLATCG